MLAAMLSDITFARLDSNMGKALVEQQLLESVVGKTNGGTTREYSICTPLLHNYCMGKGKGKGKDTRQV